MTSCERYQPWMVEALYGELDEERRAEFDAHLCECADCAALFSELRATADLMDRRRRPDPGPEYWDGYWNRLQQRVAREDSVVVDASRFARRRSLGSWGYRVAAVVALLAAGAWLGRTVWGPSPEPNVVATTQSDSTRPQNHDENRDAPANPLLDTPGGVDEAAVAQDRSEDRAPIDAPSGTGERAPDGNAGDATVLVSNEHDAQRYIERSQLLLLAVLNGDPADSSSLDLQRQRAGELVRVASSVRESSSDRRVQELVAQLELILREIAHLEQSSDVDAVELIRSRVDREGVLLRINVEQMRSENAAARSNGAID